MRREVAPFFIVKKVVVPFFVVKWLPNQIIGATLKGDHGSDSDEKLVPNIIDKNTCTSVQLRERRRIAQWTLKIAQRNTLSIEQADHLVSVLYLGMHSPQKERKQAASVLFQVIERPELPFAQKMFGISHIYLYDHSTPTMRKVLALLKRLLHSDLSRDQKVQIARKLCVYSAPSSKIQRQAIELLVEVTQHINVSAEGIIGPIIEVYDDVCTHKSSKAIICKTVAILLRLIKEGGLSFEQKVHIASALCLCASRLLWVYEQGAQILLDLAQRADISAKQATLAAQALYRSHYRKACVYGQQLLWSMIEQFEDNRERAIFAALALMSSHHALYYNDEAKEAASRLLNVLLVQPGLSPQHTLEAALTLHRYFSGYDAIEKQRQTIYMLLQLVQNQTLVWEKRLQGIQVLYQAIHVNLEERKMITQIFWQVVEEHDLVFEQRLRILTIPLITPKTFCVERVKAVRMILTVLEEDAAKHYFEVHWSPMKLEMQDSTHNDVPYLFELMMQEHLPARARDEMYTFLCQMVPCFDQCSPHDSNF